MIHGAELRVHFLKSFQKGSTCENLSQKGLKTKKDGTEEEVAEQTAEKRPKRRALTSGVMSLASLPRVVRATATDRSLPPESGSV
jgi:hypothetical protein